MGIVAQKEGMMSLEEARERAAANAGSAKENAAKTFFAGALFLGAIVGSIIIYKVATKKKSKK